MAKINLKSIKMILIVLILAILFFVYINFQIYAPMMYQSGFTGWLVLALISVVSVIIWLILRRRDLIFYRAECSTALALKESEERYRRLFETAKDGIILLDFDTGLIIDINPFLIEQLGYSEVELLKMYIWDIGIAKNTVELKKRFQELKTKKYIRFEDFPLGAKNGRIIEVDFVGNVYSVEGKNVIQCNIRDITERRQMQRNLAQVMEVQYRALIENLPGKVFLKDRNSVFISCNENYAKDLGVKSEMITGRTDYDFFPTLLAEKYRVDDRRVMESGKTENIEEEYQVITDFLEESKTIYINTVKVPVFDNVGQVAGIFGFFWDITNRKKAEAALRLSEEKIRAIFDQTFQFIGLMTLDGKLIEVNRSAMELMDISEKDCIGKFFWNTPWWTHSKELQDKLRAAVTKAANGETVVFEATHLGVDKTLHYIDFSLKPIKDREGKIAFLVPEGRDITERKKMDEELQKHRHHLEEMVEEKTRGIEKALRIKSEFTGMVTHELRTPLAAIKEGISVVLDKVLGEINEEQIKYLSIAKNNVDRLARLINEVLDFEKLDSEKIEFVMQPNDVNEVVKGVWSIMEPLFKKKSLSFELELTDGLPLVKFDKDKIIQVLTNLVNNAYKFTEKGKVTIVTKKTINFIQVTVSDTGIGIKEEDIPKLYQEFTQLQRKVGGTGLGLSICKKLIQAHGGETWVESNLGQGTKIYFTLPIDEQRG